MDILLAKAESLRDDGNAFVIIYLRKNQNKSSGTVLIPSRQEVEVRICDGNSMETLRSVKEKEEVLQAQEQRFPCRPWCRPW